MRLKVLLANTLLAAIITQKPLILFDQFSIRDLFLPMQYGCPVAKIIYPVSRPTISELEIDYVTEAVKSTWIGPTGPFITRMSEYLCEAANTKYSLPVSNGTVALHLALLAVGVSPGDEVIVPAFTYIASVNAISYCGAKPVFIDVENDSWGIDPEELEKAITPKTKAVIVVHLYGMPASILEIKAICDKYNLKLVEDCAESIFADNNGITSGEVGDVSTFSFFGNKLLSTGEGGAVVTNSEDMAKKLELLRGQGMDPNRRYWFPIIGYNYRLSNVSAAIFCAQYERREEILKTRNEIFREYSRNLADNPHLNFQPEIDGRTKSPWLYCVLVDPKIRESLMFELAELGIETRPFFTPINQMPPYKDEYADIKLLNSEIISSSGINLPTYPDLLPQEIKYITTMLKTNLEKLLG